MPHGAATEQIGLPLAHFPRARAAQGEVNAAIFEEPVHLIQEARRLLNLIDHDETSLRGPQEKRSQNLRLL